MEILLIVLARCALFLYYIQHRGEIVTDYLGYYWKISIVKKGKKREEKVKIQAADARRQLIRLCESQEPIMLTLIETLGGNPMDWHMAKLYVNAARNYEPGENNQPPELIRLYAELMVTMEKEEWEIKSIEQAGWKETRTDQR